MKKGFDLVQHNILLEKLENIGIRGRANELIQSYLKDRVQKVKILDVYSNDKIIKMVYHKVQFWNHSYFRLD